MSFLNQSNVSHYALAIGIVLIASFFGNRIKDAFDTTNNDEYELIRKYLLNDSPLYGYNRPKLWIHSKYEYNARVWQSFMSRSSTDLNQPYIHLTVKTIINHCSNDFNICLIDDDSFSSLIPEWDVKISGLAEPFKSRQRELALANLLYIYGGIVVPNSFICMRNMMPLYLDGIYGEKPFTCEMINRHSNQLDPRKNNTFTSDPTFMGAPKRSPVIRDMINYLKRRNNNKHFTCEPDFIGFTSEWCNSNISTGQMNLLDGMMVGVKSMNGKPILLEDLMEENELSISSTHN